MFGKRKLTVDTTIHACFAGYIVQAIVNNFIPLLFVWFQKSYHLELTQITMLVTLNFAIQLLVDLLSAGFIDKIGYRASIILAHICTASGLILLTILPDCMGSSFTGILTAVAVYAIGGGLIEVLVSPMVEACPTDNKEKAMSLLHSFYCWGHMGVVLISTVYFALFGTQNWKILARLWALIPLGNMLVFAKTPIYTLGEEGETGLSFKELVSTKAFWVLMVMMTCAGASEQAVGQWASTFAEKGLGVSKTVGDLMGPMAFAAMMGLSRVIYGKYGDKLDLNACMTGSCVLCVAAYLWIALIPIPMLGLISCAVCGFSVGILWPGTFSTAAVQIKGGGTVMFALLALAGDLGCSSGPTLAGFASSMADNNLRMGTLAAIVFPAAMLLCLICGQKTRK